MTTGKGVLGLILGALACAACATPAPADRSASAPAHLPPAHPAPGNAFEEAFAHEDGVYPIRGGGWIKPLREGSGASPTADSTVTVHYRGTLTDGTEFDSSYKRGYPATFPLRGVIPCWTRGVPMMAVGGKAKLVCPSAVAYGDRGSPPVIPGKATLVFEIELLRIVQ